MLHTKFNIKILVIIVISLIMSSYLSHTLFIAGTTRINLVYLTRLKQLPGTFLNNSQYFIASLFRKTPTLTPQQNTVVAQMKNLPVTALQLVAQGVYAQENTDNNIIFVRITKDTNLQGLQTINVNGRLIKIYISPRKVK